MREIFRKSILKIKTVKYQNHFQMYLKNILFIYLRMVLLFAKKAKMVSKDYYVVMEFIFLHMV